METLNKIIEIIKIKAFPLIESFESSPSILDQLDISIMDKFHENWIKTTGVTIVTTDLRFAWAITLIFENSDIKKAEQFAAWGIAQPDNSGWFGNNDFKRILKK